MLALVFVNVVINYLDRANLGVAMPILHDELGLTTIQRGYIFAAFGWAYAVLQIPGGVLADRLGPRVLYAICLLSWSVATIFQGIVRGFAGLFALRLATGAFEAPSYPVNNRVVTTWFPGHERASAIAMFVSGQFIGLAILSPVMAIIANEAGWRGLFIVTGVAGLIWAVLWYLFYRDPMDHPFVNQPELDYIEKGGGMLHDRGPIVSDRRRWKWSDLRRVMNGSSFWGIYIAQFSVNVMLWFFLTWFPSYLEEYRGISFKKFAALPYLSACAGLLLSGFVSDYLIKRGHSINVARKLPIIIGMLLSTTIVGANYVSDTPKVIFFMSLAFFGAGVALISWVFVSIVSPKNLIGLTGGVFNFMGNLASIAVPITIGHLVKGGDFRPALTFIGAFGIVGALSYAILVDVRESASAERRRS